MRLTRLAILTSCFWFAACGNDTTVPLQQPGQTPAPAPAPTSSSPPASAPTYTFVQNTILTPHCNSCHSGSNPSAGLDFTSWENLVHNPVRSNLVVPGNANASALFIDGQGNVSLTADQSQALFDWIKAGAPNN